MIRNLPLQFNYIPYPLWRRKVPRWMQSLAAPLIEAGYPVKEDRTPPLDAAEMADYLVRFKLMPQMDYRDLFKALEAQPAEIEYTAVAVPQIAAELPVRIPAQWETNEAIIVNFPVLYPPLWEQHAQMIEAIAPVAQVMVMIPAPMFAHAISVYLNLRGKLGNHADNVRYLNLPVNDIWVRDYGPIVGINASGQRVVLNSTYDHLPMYPQTMDDAMPSRWAAHIGMPVRDVDLHTEGGNLWSDGEGTLIMADRIFEENPGYDLEKLESYLHTLIDYDKLILTPRLNIEQTGHVDLLVKLANRNTVLVSSSQTVLSRKPLKAAAELFQRETNARGERYSVFELPTPLPYLNWFAYPIRRSYTNSLTVNGRVLVPVYSLPADDVALRVYELAMPSYEIIPIDCTIGANGGGAVHCMTKEIPAAVNGH